MSLFYVTLMSSQLHWFLVKQHIHFKIATLTYCTIQSGSPSYLSSLINLNASSRLLRSSSHNLLHVPFTTTAIGCKAFSFAAPTVWNSIPLSIRQSPSIGSFKRHLKTHLFTSPASPFPHPATPVPPTRACLNLCAIL